MADAKCPKCEGTGWRPIETDGVRQVMRCDCYVTDRTTRLLQAARIPRRYEHCSFENFANSRKIPMLAEAHLVAQRYCEEYPLDYGLLFVGPTGAGKTHLAVSVLRSLAQTKGVGVRFSDFHQLLQEIQSTYDPASKGSRFEVLRPILDVEIFLLDELAGLRVTDWVRETLAYIINSRYNDKKVTLITTTLGLPKEKETIRPNYTPSGEVVPEWEKSLSQLGPTLCSRLYEMCRVVKMGGIDFRREIKQADYIDHWVRETGPKA